MWALCPVEENALPLGEGAPNPLHLCVTDTAHIHSLCVGATVQPGDAPEMSTSVQAGFCFHPGLFEDKGAGI